MSVATVFTHNTHLTLTPTQFYSVLEKPQNNLNSTDTQSFVLLQYASAACLTSELQHNVSTDQSVRVFPLSNVSDIPDDPCPAALCSPESQWDKFLCFRYQLFIKCPALARLGLATFVRIVDRYIGE